MYSAEQRMKAVETFARFGCSAADTIAELGYPTRHTLRNWWREYQIGGDGFLERKRREPKYSRRGEAGRGRLLPRAWEKPRPDDKGHGIPEPRDARQLDRRARARQAQAPAGPIPRRAFCRSRRRCRPWRSSRPGAAAPPRSPTGTAYPAPPLTPGGGRSWGIMEGRPKRKGLP